MRLTKDNCHASCYEALKECILENDRNAIPDGTRVIEVPKVWREYGIQYKVTRVWLTFFTSDSCVIKAPRGCDVITQGCLMTLATIQYYD